MSDTAESTSTGRRQCFYIPAGQFDSEGYIPSMVTEGVAGHVPLPGQPGRTCSQPWHWGTTYKEARAVCDGENMKIGITPEAANEIILSSMTGVLGDLYRWYHRPSTEARS
jgi:hypothetical protein